LHLCLDTTSARQVGKITSMPKLVNIFADDTVRELATSMVHQNETQRERTKAKIRARLRLMSPESMRRLVNRDLLRRRAAMLRREGKSN
jgi:hypothetical protein